MKTGSRSSPRPKTTAPLQGEPILASALARITDALIAAEEQRERERSMRARRARYQQD